VGPEQPYRYRHSVFFRLSDRTASTRQSFVDLTWQLLAIGHPGMLSCAIGFRDELMQRAVNDLRFDISLDMIFESREAYDAYRNHPQHQEWVARAGSMNPERTVFDFFLLEPPAKTEPGAAD
jgi:hypothetical protein